MISPLALPTLYESTFGTYSLLRRAWFRFRARSSPAMTSDISQEGSTESAIFPNGKRGFWPLVKLRISTVAIGYFLPRVFFAAGSIFPSFTSWLYSLMRSERTRARAWPTFLDLVREKYRRARIPRTRLSPCARREKRRMSEAALSFLFRRTSTRIAFCIMGECYQNQFSLSR